MTNSYHSHRCYSVLNLVSHLGPISRTKLISLTDYRPASVGAMIKELQEEKLLVETGFYSSGHGRKRALLEINKDYICAIGISFTSAMIIHVVTRFDGKILRREETPFSPATDKSALEAKIIAVTQMLIQAFADRKIVGVGIGDPLYGPGYFDGSDSSYAHFINWINRELKTGLEQALALPVKCFSAVTLPALIEQRFGVARGAKNFFCVELSNGIGSSICCNGIVVGGSRGAAGELGHTVINYEGEGGSTCYCGKSGCVEHAAAFPSISKEIGKALEQGVYSVLNEFYDRSRPLTVQDIRRALDEGDQLCRHHVRKAAERIGVSIANAVNLLNPELVVLYGFMMELGPYFLSRLEDAIRENVVYMARDFEIKISSTVERTMPLGAAAEMFCHYLKMDDYLWVYRIQPSDVEEEWDGKEEPEE